MNLKEFIDMYDDPNSKVVVNNNRLKRIAADSAWLIYALTDYEDIRRMEVVAFGHYDDELTIRVNIFTNNELMYFRENNIDVEEDDIETILDHLWLYLAYEEMLPLGTARDRYNSVRTYLGGE